MKLRKDGQPDMRYRENKKGIEMTQRNWIRAIVCAVLLGALLACFLVRPRVASEDTLNIDYPEMEDKLEPDPTPLPEVQINCNNPIGYIRCKGEELGYSNEVIKTMIRIAKAESTMGKYLYNYLYDGENGRYTAKGLFMITNSTWKGNKCDGDPLDYKDSTDCAYEIYSHRGYQPWAESAVTWLASN